MLRWILSRIRRRAIASGAYFVFDANQVRQVRQKLRPDQAKLFDELVYQIQLLNDGVIRAHHLVWVAGVIEGVHPRTVPPTLDVPADLPYDLANDPGRPLFQSYALDVADGEVVRGFRTLAVGVSKKSPICLCSYGVAIVQGRVPGREPDPAGVALIEEAIHLTRGGCGAFECAMLFINGVHLPVDVERSVRLLQAAYFGGANYAADELALIYSDGPHGWPKNPYVALAWALKGASRGRRFLADLGLPQDGWLSSHLARLRECKRYAAMMSGQDRERLKRSLIEPLR